MKLASPVLEDPSAESRFSCRSSSTKLALYGHHRCCSPRKIFLLVSQFPFVSSKLSIFPIAVIVSWIPSSSPLWCPWFDQHVFSVAHQYACSMWTGHWPKTTSFLVFCHNRRFVCELLKVLKEVVKTFVKWVYGKEDTECQLFYLNFVLEKFYFPWKVLEFCFSDDVPTVCCIYSCK